MTISRSLGFTSAGIASTMPKYKGVLKRRRLYYGYVHYKNKRYWSKGFVTAEEASKWSAKTKSELMNNVFIEKNKVTIQL